MTTPSDPTPPPEQTTDPYQQQPGPLPAAYGAPAPAPRPRTNPWVWVAIGVLALGVLATFVVPMLFFFGGAFLFDDYDDEYYDDEMGYYVEQGSVDRAMEPACDTLEEAAGSVRLFGSATQGAADLRRLAVATGGMSEAIDGADPNSNAQQLSSDWRQISASLKSYADRLGDDAAATFQMPEVEGEYVSNRIYNGNDTCYVPTVLLALDPETAAGGIDGPYGY